MNNETKTQVVSNFFFNKTTFVTIDVFVKNIMKTQKRKQILLFNGL